ncbi:ATP-binding protein [Geodermatophilus sp. CPCC 206100]|uniref:ATP-binding protein n=1 Tax=Geodermatophilus sp. CPCC 206100 TaxID=3020054 RepID=UPI003B00E8A5
MADKMGPLLVRQGNVTGEQMSATSEPSTINVEPHPRLLGVLGDIELAPWQCIAELVDNAFDEFLRQHGGPGDLTAEGEAPTVTVTLPSKGSGPRDGEVWVSDNGPGMSRDQLRSALRAGWSSNDRVGRLGLYGVGFNIATARLGHVAVVKTARSGDPAWTVVTLDLRALAKGDHYDLPLTTEPKKAPGEHGTVVVIRDLKPEHHETLSRRQAKIKDNLGDVYSHLLAERGFVLNVDRYPVKPRLACLWDESRSVVRNGERIPAVIRIDEQLADRHVCLDCGTWQDDLDGRCESCQSDRLKAEPRRIWGWVGIQRYLHTSDYGIDFIRNGRKILVRDTSMFQWQDPDDASGRGESEYPLEMPRAGRIVGEIHVDHVRVNYQKSAFDYDTPEWKKVVQVVRGRGPLQPKKAAAAGYGPNTSPLARLLSGYRRNDAGLNYLIPGDGKNALHDRAREWAQLFRNGDPRYQTDEEWYRAAQRHDEPQPTAPDPRDGGGAGDADGGDDGGDILKRKGLLDDEPGDTTTRPEPAPAVESEEQRRARWRAHGDRLPDLETKFGLPGHGAPLEVTAYLVRKQTLQRADGEPVPVYVAADRGARVEVFIDADHKVFTDFAVDTRDLVVMELAEYLRVRSGQTERALSALFYDLKEKCLPDHKVSGLALNDVAVRLLERVREGMQPVVAGNSTGYWSLLAPDEQASAEQKYALEGGTASWEDDVLTSGEWISYVPGMALVRLLNARADAFLDGRVFRSAHDGLSSPEARAISVERVADLLGDVAVLADRPIRRGAEELQRGRLSCVLLEREINPVELDNGPPGGDGAGA